MLARLLPPEDFGLLALGFTLVVFGHALSSGGLGAELIRREVPPERADLASVLGFQLVITVPLALGAVIVGTAVGGAAGVGSVMALSIPLVILRTPNQIMLEREMRFGDLTRAEVAETAVYNVLAIALVLAGLGVRGVAAATVVQGAVGSAIVIKRGPVGLVRPSLSLDRIRPIYRFGVSYQAVSVVAALRDYGINIVLALTAGLSAVGIWSLAARLFQAIMLLLQAIWRVSFSAMSRLKAAGEADAVLDRMLRLTSIAVGVLVVLLGGTAPALVPAVFGTNWSEAIDVLPLGAAALMIWGPISTTFAGYLYAHGQARSVLNSAIGQTIGWLGATAALAPVMGSTAGGVGMIVGATVTVVALTHAVRPHVHVAAARILSMPALGATAGGGVAWLVATAVSPVGVALAVSAVAGAGVYAAVVLATRREDVRSLLRVGARALPGR